MASAFEPFTARQRFGLLTVENAEGEGQSERVEAQLPHSPQVCAHIPIDAVAIAPHAQEVAILIDIEAVPVGMRPCMPSHLISFHVLGRSFLSEPIISSLIATLPTVYTLHTAIDLGCAGHNLHSLEQIFTADFSSYQMSPRRA